MRKLVISVTALAGVGMLAPASASAEAPQVLLDDTITDSYTIAGLCPFDVQVDEVLDVRITRFVDGDAHIEREHVRVDGRATWSGPTDRQFTERWSQISLVEFDEAGEPIIETVSGNMYNIHQPGTGVVVNGSGRATYDLTAREFTFAAGPLEGVTTPPTDVCALLA